MTAELMNKGLGTTASMSIAPIRNLQIVEWMNGAPHRALCTCCRRLFVLIDATVLTVQGARDDLENQFRNHLCDEQPPSRSAA